MLWYGSRHYDPELGRFIQPDSIVPLASQGVQAWDRYAYVNNSPINYTDPTGHMLDAGEGAGCGAECRREQIFKMHNWLRTLAEEEVFDHLEALARLTEYAALVSENCTRCFVNDLGAIFTGHTGDDGKTAAYRELLKNGIKWPGITYHPYYEQISGTNELMQFGYASVFHDPSYEAEGMGGNQAHHYWFYVQSGYELGFYPAVLGDLVHETSISSSAAGKSFNDYALGVEGAHLGAALNQGLLEPSEVGDYIRQTLSPSSEIGAYWSIMKLYLQAAISP